MEGTGGDAILQGGMCVWSRLLLLFEGELFASIEEILANFTSFLYYTDAQCPIAQAYVCL